MSKKNLIFLTSFILILIIFFLFYYFTVLAPKKSFQEELPFKITTAYLAKFPNIERTNTFRQGESLGFIGKIAELEESVAITFQVLDNKGRINEFPPLTVYGDGKIEWCCAPAPETPGSYYMKIFFDEKEVFMFPFEIID